MKVTILSHSDRRGGAAVVSVRLMEALRDAGLDARMLVMHKDSDNPNILALEPEWRRQLAFLGECATIYTHNGFSRDNLFKVSVANTGMPVSKHPWVREADVVLLGWVNQGMVSLREIARIEAPVVWAMHDMWCMTGVCHHAGECVGYRNACGNCPLLHRGVPYSSSVAYPTDLSWVVRRRKDGLYAAKRITFVAISRWLADNAKRSSLLRSQRVEIIPNPFPIEEFYVEPKRSRKELGLPDGKLIAMGAARLDDSIKGLDLAIEALNALVDTDAKAVLFGGIKNPKALDGLKLPYVHLGNVTDPELLREIYAHCSVVLSSSHYETLPTTLIEGMAAGCVPVSFDQGGQSDIVDHLRTGYLAKYPDTENLADGLRLAITNPPASPSELRSAVASRFSAPSVAMRYILLFEQLTKH